VSHYALALAFVVVPLAAALLASREVRAWLRGTGSIRQTLSNAGVGLLFLAAQLGLRGALFGAFAGLAALVPWELPPEPWAYVLAFVLLDFVYYVQHRLEHAVPLLWAVHSVHHQSRDYNLSVSLRLGALSSLSTLAFHATLALAGVGAAMYAGVVVVHAALLFGLHARTKFAFGPGRFFNAPVFHRVHHGAEAAYIDKNFGGVLLVFDRLLGTFAPYTEEPSFGVVGEASLRNPLRANVAPLAALAAAVRRQPTLAKKLRALFVRADGG
jgi:sterol desaturase/sphingolipid hydroxylase (fatty acid hydroxylase superfamily)